MYRFIVCRVILFYMSIFMYDFVWKFVSKVYLVKKKLYIIYNMD